MDFVTILLLLICGFFSGVIVSMTSGTTWIIMIPCLTILLNHSIYPSIGTVLIIDAIVGIIAGAVFLLRKRVDLKAVAYVSIPGMIAAYVGSIYTAGVNESNLTIFTGILLIAIGFVLATKGIKDNVQAIESKINLSPLRRHKLIVLPICGLLIGFVSGFFGMGSGGSVMFVLVLVLGYSIHEAIGTALITMFFIASVGAFGQYMHNSYGILLIEGVIAGAAAAVGAFSGSNIANILPEEKLGKTIGVLVVLVGVLVIAKSFFI